MNNGAVVWFFKTFRGAKPIKIDDRLTYTIDKKTAPFSPRFPSIATYYLKEYKGSVVAVHCHFLKDWDDDIPYARDFFSNKVEFL